MMSTGRAVGAVIPVSTTRVPAASNLYCMAEVHRLDRNQSVSALPPSPEPAEVVRLSALAVLALALACVVSLELLQMRLLACRATCVCDSGHHDHDGNDGVNERIILLQVLSVQQHATAMGWPFLACLRCVLRLPRYFPGGSLDPPARCIL